MTAIYRKELKAYFSSLFGYAVVASLLLGAGIFLSLLHLMSAYTDFSIMLIAMQWVLLAVIPFFCLYGRTELWLLSLPLTVRDLVLGKFAALLTLFLIPTAVTALYPLLLRSMGEISIASAYSALLGYVLLGAALISLCLFAASLAKNRIWAVVLGFAAVLLIYFLNALASLIPDSPLASLILCMVAALGIGALFWHTAKSFIPGLIAATLLIFSSAILYFFKTPLFDSLVPRFLRACSLFDRAADFSGGYLDLGSVVFFLSWIAFFLFLTVQSTEKRRRA